MHCRLQTDSLAHGGAGDLPHLEQLSFSRNELTSKGLPALVEICQRPDRIPANLQYVILIIIVITIVTMIVIRRITMIIILVMILMIITMITISTMITVTMIMILSAARQARPYACREIS